MNYFTELVVTGPHLGSQPATDPASIPASSSAISSPLCHPHFTYFAVQCVMVEVLSKQITKYIKAQK